jgi:hypothetical protein
MEPYLWWGAVVKPRFALLGPWGHLRVRDTVGWTTLLARRRPALPRCADGESGDKMIDRVSSPRVAFAVARSLEAVSRPTGAGGRLHSGADRKHLRDNGQARGVRCDQAAAATTSSVIGAGSIGASASSPSSRRMWYARRQSLRATDKQARLWSIRRAT